LAISGMTCNHCVAAVAHALGQCRGVASVQVNLATSRAVVTGEQLSAKELVAAVESAGYRVANV
jgi:P-type Cu+ transporter